MLSNAPPVFRFAPSPNGALHLGHAYSALLNQQMAQAADGMFLIRIEDIDTTRCTPELEQAMLEDLAWLGIASDLPPVRQSDHFDVYADALETLRDAGLIYAAFMTRGEIKRFVEQQTDWPKDPDGSPLYPGEERNWSTDQQEAAIYGADQFMWRLDMTAAAKHVGGELVWVETGCGPQGAGETGEILANPYEWGDIILARSDIPASYHLSVTLDDAKQGITHVVRGRDLFYATSVHRLLQTLLGLPVPIYHHHDLILGEDQRKLSKSAGDTSLRALRNAGLRPTDIIRMVGLTDNRVSPAQ